MLSDTAPVHKTTILGGSGDGGRVRSLAPGAVVREGDGLGNLGMGLAVLMLEPAGGGTRVS